MKLDRLLLLAACLLSLTIHGKEPPHKKSVAKSNSLKMADCVPPSGYRQFDLNNVRFGLETAGQLWMNRPGGSIADYEVPKGSGIHSLFAGGLWMGGITSTTNAIKVSAVTFRQGGTDFWPGPLNETTATVESETCDEYDRHWLIKRKDVEIHRLWFERQKLVSEGLAPEAILSEDPFENGYSIPDYFYDYPAINLNPLAQRELAPYFDANGDDFYDPEDGDYPGYDLRDEIDCTAKCATDPIPLFGDETLWWVFNDNGGIHTEFGGEAIGMEVRAQAFAFTSNDEINNMTFCNYTLINRGNQTLEQTYFGQWVDPDLGCGNDDFVGCDVQRGLGYCYNGDSEDENCAGQNGYGIQPPAVGIDFFEGPFQDADQRDNPDTTDIAIAINESGIPYEGLGIGYGDDIGDPAFCSDPNCCDNERFGMRKFVYYNNSNAAVNGDPDIDVHVYNYLRGIWKNGQRMTWGGDGTIATNTPTDYMFPGDTDPLGWATGGVELATNWTEEEEENTPADRRFLQSAGPFTLDPGEFNNITVGVVWARALSGGRLESIKELQRADDKAQSLFDNCFKLLSGPDSPDIAIQELDQQLVIYLSNNNSISSNYEENYEELDPQIPDTYSDGTPIPEEEKYYKFQGYKIYQVKDESVSASDLDDDNLARLAFQCDIEDYTEEGDGIGQIINWEFDPDIGQVIPVGKVDDASNSGISHSFLVTEDLFATESNKLVNHTKYYFIAIAYGYNNYEDYNYVTQTGMARPYIESRSSGSKTDVPTVCGIPHIPLPEASGTDYSANYGDSFEIIRLEGEGNGGLELELSEESIAEIMSGEPWRADDLKYKANFGPVNVKVVDPLNVKNASLQLSFFVPDSIGLEVDEEIDMEHTYWLLYDQANPEDTIATSLVSIGNRNEQIVPELGISIQIEQYEYSRSGSHSISEVINSEIVYEDPEKAWLTGVADVDGLTPANWILSGTVEGEDIPLAYTDYIGKDNNEIYEGILGGSIAPWYMTSRYDYGPADLSIVAAQSLTDAEDLSGVDIVFTSDKSKWTRVPVLEMEHESQLTQGEANKTEFRMDLSVDKNGLNQNHPSHNHGECTYQGEQVFSASDIDELNSSEKDRYKEVAFPGIDPDSIDDSELIGLSFGMGWFPGYAIDVESGQRLNMAFGESSWFAGENGRDMIWNPTSTLLSSTFEYRGAGLHYIFVYRNDRADHIDNIRMPGYDGANYLFDYVNGSSTEKRRVWRSCMWVMFPQLIESGTLREVSDGLIPTETKVRIRNATPYKRFATYKYKYPEYFTPDGAGVDYDNIEPFADILTTQINGQAVSPFISHEDDARNHWLPSYQFDTEGLKSTTNDLNTAQAALDLINVVPNPYYAYSNYVEDRLDNRVKLVNIPERCNVKIYDASGILVRTFIKDNIDTFLEWDLKNEQNIPISGGMYILHIEAPGIGEKIVKWFGVVRPVDLNNF